MKHILALICAVLLAGCQATGDTISIGVVGPYSGQAAFFGEWGRTGFEIAADRIEAETGRKINLVYEDDQCDSAPAITAVNKLRHVDDIRLMVGLLCGGPTAAVAPWTEENDAIMVSAGDSFGHLSDNFYSTRFLVREEARLLAEFAYNNLSLRRIGIVYLQNEWGHVLQEEFTQRFTELGGTVAGAESYGFSAPDFRPSLLKFKEANVDGVYMVYTTIGEIVNQIAELNMNVTKIGDSQIENEQSITIGGSNLEGTIYLRPVAPTTSSAQTFVTEYIARTGHAPDTVAYDSHDALLVLVHALQQCTEDDLACIREQLQQTQGLQGANGELTFNKKLWGFEKEFMIKVFKGGEPRAYTGQ